MKRVRFIDFQLGTLTIEMEDLTVYLFEEIDNYELDISNDSHAQILIDNGHFEEIL